MENLFQKLGIWKQKEITRVQMVKWNLLPHIQIQLSLIQVRTIVDLIQHSRAVEEMQFHSECFCPPPTNGKFIMLLAIFS